MSLLELIFSPSLLCLQENKHAEELFFDFSLLVVAAVLFTFAMYPSHLYRGMGGSNGRETQMGFNLSDAVLDLKSSIISPRSSSNLTAVTSSSPLHSQFGGGLAHGSMGSLEMDDSGMVVASPLTDTSTDVEIEGTNQFLGGGHHGAIVSRDCSVVSQEKTGEVKALRRLSQNREAARKSRLRKKAYVQQLESSRLRLMQLEQELQRARQQGIFIASGSLADHGYAVGANGALAFDLEYARWLDKHQCQINDIRAALNSHLGDEDLRLLVDAVMSHYDEVFKLKSIAAKADVFHMLSGMWTTPAERCFMWLGGFRSSELLKILAGHLEPLTEQQLMGICNLQQSSQQAEDALSQGMEALQQSLADTLAAVSPRQSPYNFDNVANYTSHMAMAMAKLSTLENFVRQADFLRQQTLQQMHRILTTRQAARALLAISDYFSRLRALSSLWLARPKG